MLNSIVGTKVTFLGRNLIKKGRNTLTPLTLFLLHTPPPPKVSIAFGPTPPYFNCFPSTAAAVTSTTTQFLLFYLYYHHHMSGFPRHHCFHISIVFPLLHLFYRSIEVWSMWVRYRVDNVHV